MTLAQIILSQLSDPFRLGLIVALMFTALRTRQAMGMAIPLSLGVVFIAAMIPMTLPSNTGEPLVRLVIAGLVANAVLLGVVLGIYQLVQKVRGQ